jgi:predicted molibdopterin-dependent oxidoreductase YjgC
MSPTIVEMFVNGRMVNAQRGSTVAATLLNGGVHGFRTSERGEPRAALCGMGICYECRVTVDGVAHQRACMTIVASGMQVDTAERA